MFSIWLLEISSSFQGTKTSRSWIKRLWCSGHTGTTKASTSTKLLNFTTKLLKLSWRNPPKSPARWVPRVSFCRLKVGSPKKHPGPVMQFVDFLPWRHCSHGWKNIFESLKCLLFWTSSEKKKKTEHWTSSRIISWMPRESSKISFFPTQKKGLTDNQSKHWRCHPTRNALRQPRYVTVLACNYQTPTVREDSLSRVRKRTHEKRYHNLNQKRRWFLLRLFDGFEQKQLYCVGSFSHLWNASEKKSNHWSHKSGLINRSSHPCL